MSTSIDLHIHTNMSDGVFSPKEIIDIAKENNVEYLSITDHDNIDAYSDELFDYAERRNMILIPGVEISTKIDKCGIHVLGYNFDINNEELRNKLKVLRNTRHDYLVKVAKKLEELGYKVNVEELDKIDSVTKSHIALDIIGNEENLDMLHKDFNHLPGKSEFIEALLIEGCPAYVKKEGITPKEAADLIRGAGGKVALAHPVCYKYEDGLTDEDILELVNNMKLDAIEANYHYVDRNDNRIDESDHWREFAKKHNLICSVGSDFHLDDGIRPVIGFRNWDIEFSREDAYKILDYLSN
jgi:predicted metal-dependent phosphoesterase TrpH